MNPREAGFLLLTSRLGNPDRKPLSVAQLRILAQRMRTMTEPEENRNLTRQDLQALGYDRETAQRILALLEEEALLEHYVRQGRKLGCIPITRVSDRYPLILRQRLGLDSPGCLWAKGNLRLLDQPAIALVGSRDLNRDNRKFAAEVGRQAGRAGLVLISGNARGADRTAQEACLAAGGSVISVVADELTAHNPGENMLYLSEEAYDEPFSTPRALSRNRVIHALGRMVFVAQSDLEKGGTWDGTTRNLRFGWSSVACFRDGSEVSRELEQMGAYLVNLEDLQDFATIPMADTGFL